MDHAAVAEMPEARATWSRQGRGGQRAVTCKSAECRYVAEAGQVLGGPDDDRDPLVPDHVGQRVERAVVAVGNPFRDVLALWYVRRMPVQIIGWRLGLPDAALALDQAHQAVAARRR